MDAMKLEDFDYELPEELIAQEPAEIRDRSRMLVVHRDTGRLEIRSFHDLPDYLGAGDTVVVNDSRVFPARLIGHKETGGLIELLLTRRREGPSGTVWEALLRPAKRVSVGTDILFDGRNRARIIARISEKQWLLSFEVDGPFDGFLIRFGRAPLPPYIRRRRDHPRSLQDLERYQTVYARVSGSVAAPTAGLHFSKGVLARIGDRGAKLAAVTLHVGYGTFLPITAERVEDHVMEEEHFAMTAETARQINGAERVIAVGTTATRVLESAADENGHLEPAAGATRLYIYPGYRFRCVDGLLTNFHLPKSSLFLLVCAFAGRERMLEAYRFAIDQGFRFYSYGDCMLIL